MKASDITDEQVLGAVAAVEASDPSRMVDRWRLAAHLEVPMKVLLAKAQKMIRRGALRGCACGCRGDFELPP